ncbi:hypothetical protein [Cylindrospermopsis raciborskii]|nr:hypothetical protein [Cylindrospermopsis raciborskii]
MNVVKDAIALGNLRSLVSPIFSREISEPSKGRSHSVISVH